MEVIVIGAGAVGLLVASYLGTDKNVTIVTRRTEQANALNQYGLIRINTDQTIHQTSITAMTEIPLHANALVIVAVKYGQLQSIYPLLNLLSDTTPLLFLQNGLAHFEEALTLPQKNIAFGSVQFGAEKENDNTVNHRGLGLLKIAVERGNTDLYKPIMTNNLSNFPIEFTLNAEQMLFEKALLNCFINPLTALLKVKNGYLIEHNSTLQILERLFHEFKNAFPKEMDKFVFDDVLNLCKNTATNTSSMLSDLLNERPTEIETITGAIIKKAAKKGKKLPTLTTLYYLIKSEEEKRVE